MIDWDKKIEWSSGEEAWVRFNSFPADGTKEVTGCERWWELTGDEYVHVDSTTGKILGCEEEEDLPSIRNRMPAARQPELA